VAWSDMLVEKGAMELITRIMAKGGSIDLPAQGDSMFPFIKKGDICTFVLCEPSELKKGEVVLFHLQPGQLVAHRFYERKLINNQQYFIFKGDTNLGFDQPVREDEIIGKLTFIKRNKKKVSVLDLHAYAWGKLILTLPTLSIWLRSYLNRKNNFQF
jgi:signal peptidase